MINLIILILSIIGTVLLYVFKALTFSSVGSYFLPLAIFLGFFVALQGVYIAYLYITSLMISRKKEYDSIDKYHKFTLVSTLRWILQWGRAKVVVTNKELFPKDKNCMVVCNHRSNFDPICIGATFTKPHICFVSKFSNLTIPIAGNHIHRNLYMGIDRENARNAMKTINRAANLMKEKGYSIGVFPEGTRNKDNKGLLEFKPGCFKIAAKAEKPIVVLTCTNAINIHKNSPFKRTVVHLDVLEVIEYDQYKDLQTSELSDRIKSLMSENLKKYDKE